jgi:hypothetical protein
VKSQDNTRKESWWLPKRPLLSSALRFIELAVPMNDSGYFRMIENQVGTISIQGDFGDAFISSVTPTN